MTDGSKKVFRVLSLDGGGMRGLYTACVLKGVMERFRTESGKELDIGKGFDLVVGTSTGGIIACGLAAGLSIDKMIDLYEKQGTKIFKNPKPSEEWKIYCWAISNLCKPANPNQHLRETLQNLFHAETFGQLYERRQIGLCLTSVDLLTEESRVFKTGHIESKKMDNPISLVDACMATSAAPIYLPLVWFDSPLGSGYNVFADGGLWANNPVLVGLVEALAVSKREDEIEIVSIGTRPEPGGALIRKDKMNRGLKDWVFGTKALSLSMNAQASGANSTVRLLTEQLRELGKEVRLVRLPQTTPSAEHMRSLQLDLSSSQALNDLKALGAKDAIETYKWCQDKTSIEGKIISSVFQSMPPLEVSEVEESRPNV